MLGFSDILARDEEGLTPLHYASRFKRESKKKILTHGEDGTVMQVTLQKHPTVNSEMFTRI